MVTDITVHCLVTLVAMSVVIVTFVIVTMSIIAGASCTCCLVLMLCCGVSLIVKVGGGQPHLLSGNMALGIQVRSHKRMMGVLTRE